MNLVKGGKTSVSRAMAKPVKVPPPSKVMHVWYFTTPGCFLCQSHTEETQTCIINPLSPNSDQHQISPCNINAYSTPEVMRIKDINTQGDFFLDIFNTFSPENY